MARLRMATCRSFNMTWTRRLSVTSRKFLAALLVLIFLHLIRHSNVDLHAEKREYSLNDSPSAQEANDTLFLFENLTMVPPQVALEIENIWRDELAEVTLQGNRSVTDQMVEAGGQPERVLLITKWRSGSSFLGSILRSKPGTHYFYEPLFNSYRPHLVRGESEIHDALRILKNLLHCQNLERHITLKDKRFSFHSRNAALWKVAKGQNIQGDPTFRTLMCRRSPVLAMKIVRLGLRQAEALLDDEKLNVKVIFLVRNPGATMNSRLKLEWCTPKPDCKNISMLCSDLVDDYTAAKQLEGKYSNRFMKLRYEDLLTRSETWNRLYRFLNIITTSSSSGSGLAQVRKGTGQLSGNKNLPNVQKYCTEAMDIWGYISPQALPANISDI